MAAPFAQDSQIYTTQESHALPPPDYGGGHAAHNYFLVSEALQKAGLESSRLIVGIDFTRSNEWTGQGSFHGKSLHHIWDTLNPYEQAISIIGKTLAPFNKENTIACFGFGDESTRAGDVFSFYPDERFCNGVEEAVSRYREIVPHLVLAGPTSFAPIIEMAMTTVGQSGGQFHVLLIIADNQVDNLHEQKTVDAIVKASKFPLSIILVGVGDQAWDMMEEFDVNIADNFHFVNFTEIMLGNMAASEKETEFSLAALVKVPSRYKAIKELNMLTNQVVISAKRFPISPPLSSYPVCFTLVSSAPAASSSTAEDKICGICREILKDTLAFGCGHQMCSECGIDLETCPLCRSAICIKIPFTSTCENQVCPICECNPNDVVFDCGHQTCRNCGNDLEACHICESPINKKVELY